jgi:hypothetical protein
MVNVMKLAKPLGNSSEPEGFAVYSLGITILQNPVVCNPLSAELRIVVREKFSRIRI